VCADLVERVKCAERWPDVWFPWVEVTLVVGVSVWPANASERFGGFWRPRVFHGNGGGGFHGNRGGGFRGHGFMPFMPGIGGGFISASQRASAGAITRPGTKVFDEPEPRPTREWRDSPERPIRPAPTAGSYEDEPYRPVHRPIKPAPSPVLSVEQPYKPVRPADLVRSGAGRDRPDPAREGSVSDRHRAHSTDSDASPDPGRADKAGARGNRAVSGNRRTRVYASARRNAFPARPGRGGSGEYHSGRQRCAHLRNHGLVESKVFDDVLLTTSVRLWRFPEARAVAGVVRELGAETALLSIQPNYIYELQQTSDAAATAPGLLLLRSPPRNQRPPDRKRRRRRRPPLRALRRHRRPPPP